MIYYVIGTCDMYLLRYNQALDCVLITERELQMQYKFNWGASSAEYTLTDN